MIGRKASRRGNLQQPQQPCFSAKIRHGRLSDPTAGARLHRQLDPFAQNLRRSLRIKFNAYELAIRLTDTNWGVAKPAGKTSAVPLRASMLSLGLACTLKIQYAIGDYTHMGSMPTPPGVFFDGTRGMCLKQKTGPRSRGACKQWGIG